MSRIARWVKRIEARQAAIVTFAGALGAFAHAVVPGVAEATGEHAGEVAQLLAFGGAVATAFAAGAGGSK